MTCHKRSYPSLREARTVPGRPYLCAYCDHYHVTTMTPAQVRALRRKRRRALPKREHSLPL